MPQRNPTAAQALYPHLPTKVEREQPRQEASPLAQSMWPRDKPPEDWTEKFWRLVGLRRIDGRERKR
jgi:hypothetical protein